MNYKDLADHSRVWIYQSNREFTQDEVNTLQQKLNNFLVGWATHGSALHGAATVLYNRFIVLFVDEQLVAASGCSIDSSVHFVQQLENEYKVQLMDRMQIAFRQNGAVQTLHMNDFRTAVENGTLDASTVVFNNLITNKKDFINAWEVTMENSWHKQLLPVQKA